MRMNIYVMNNSVMLEGMDSVVFPLFLNLVMYNEDIQT